MNLFFNVVTTSGNALADEKKEVASRGPWDNFLRCALERFFGHDDSYTVPATKTLVDSEEGAYTLS